MQTIKKYANRKLYHTNRKQYITLEGIATLIQAGEPVQVLDNETGEDITAAILTQVVLQARNSGDRLPTQVLTGLIRAGGDTLAGVSRSIWSTLSGASLIDLAIKQRLDHLLATGAINADELARLEALLLHDQASAVVELPSQRDISRLHAQVDTLSAAIEHLLADRDTHTSRAQGD